MSIFKQWQRSQERDSEALSKLRAGEPPTGAADIPVTLDFGFAGRAGHIVGLVLAVIGPVVIHFLFGFPLVLALLFEVVLLLFAVASALPDFTNLNVSVTISAEGVRLEKVHRSYLIPWWQVVSVRATPDLVRMRIIGSAERITFATENQPPERRVEAAQALRSHLLEHGGGDIDEWPQGSRLLQAAGPFALGVAATGIIAAGFYFLAPGGTLGMRCSVNSAFLQEEFGTPDRQGCVVLRVSAGAEKAGIQRGDLVIAMEGSPVTSGQQYSTLFEESAPPWEFTVLRRGESAPLHFNVKGSRGESFREDKDDPFFYYLRARWDAAEKPEKALRDYTRVIELEPRFDLAYVYRGHLYEEAGDREAARADYLKALELAPDLGEAHAYYAYFIDSEDPSSARQHIEKAVELDRCEDAFEGYNIDCSGDYLLLASLSLHDPPKMAGLAEQAIRFYDGFADNYYNAMCGYWMQGDAEQARVYARRYLQFPRGERVRDQDEVADGVIAGTAQTLCFLPADSWDGGARSSGLQALCFHPNPVRMTSPERSDRRNPAAEMLRSSA